MNALRLLGAALVLAPLAARPAAAQTLDPTFVAPTSLYAPGAVTALGPAQADGKRVVGGGFVRANGTDVGNVVRLEASGALDAAFAQNLGVVFSPVYRVVGLAAGQYLLCGYGSSFTAGGLTRNEAVRLNADGTADAAFNTGAGASFGGFGPGSGVSLDYAPQPDGKLVVGGYFDTFGSAPAAGVVRLNANGSVDAGFSVGTGASATAGEAVTAVALLPGGKMVLGGDFVNFNTRPANGLTQVTANGGPDASFVSPLQPNSSVENVVVQPDGKIVVSGDLYLAGAVANASVARLLPSGALDPGFSLAGFASFTDLAVTTTGRDKGLLLQPDGKLLVAGTFETSNASANVVRLNANGTLDTGFRAASDAGSIPFTIGLDGNGTVLVGGFFSTLGGTDNNLGRLAAATGAVLPAYRPNLQTAGTVRSVVRQADGKLVAGGDFNEIGGVPASRVVRLSATGTVETAYSAAAGLLPGRVNKLLLQPDGRLLVGTEVNTLRLAITGSPDPGFRVPFGATALGLQADGKVLIGGTFDAPAGGASAYGLVRVSSAGVYDAGFVRRPAPGLGNPRYTDAILVQPNGRIVVGGTYFDNNNGLPAGGYLTRCETDGRPDPSFAATSAFGNSATNASFNNRLYALALQPDGKILVGGNFRFVGPAARPGYARLTAAGALDAGFAPTRAQTGRVLALALQPNGRVLFGGNFLSPTPAPIYGGLARVLTTGVFDASFAATANPNGLVHDLLVQPDGAIVLAGSFASVSGQVVAGVARLTAPNVLAVAAPAAVAARTAAWPVPAHGRLHVLPDFSARPRAIALLDALGRPVLTVPAAAAAETVLDLTGLPAGAYLLQVQYEAGAVVRRVAVE